MGQYLLLIIQEVHFIRTKLLNIKNFNDTLIKYMNIKKELPSDEIFFENKEVELYSDEINNIKKLV